MKAISIRQPWAWAILHAGKRIENRDWRGAPSYRGPLLIHASKGCTRDEYEDAVHWMRLAGLVAPRQPIGDGCALPFVPPLAALDRGGIVARATLIDVIGPGGVYVSRCAPAAIAESAESPWYTGAYGLVLSDVQALPFVACKGALGLFDLPQESTRAARMPS